MVAWNVTSWKAVQGKGFHDYLEKEKPEIVILSETKTDEANVKGEEEEVPGYHAYFYACEYNPGYAGIACASLPPIRFADQLRGAVSELQLSAFLFRQEFRPSKEFFQGGFLCFGVSFVGLGPTGVFLDEIEGSSPVEFERHWLTAWLRCNVPPSSETERRLPTVPLDRVVECGRSPKKSPAEEMDGGRG